MDATHRTHNRYALAEYLTVSATDCRFCKERGAMSKEAPCFHTLDGALKAKQDRREASRQYAEALAAGFPDKGHIDHTPGGSPSLRAERCDECNGRGWTPGKRAKLCDECNGRAYVTVPAGVAAPAPKRTVSTAYTGARLRRVRKDRTLVTWGEAQSYAYAAARVVAADDTEYGDADRDVIAAAVLDALAGQVVGGYKAKTIPANLTTLTRLVGLARNAKRDHVDAHRNRVADPVDAETGADDAPRRSGFARQTERAEHRQDEDAEAHADLVLGDGSERVHRRALRLVADLGLLGSLDAYLVALDALAGSAGLEQSETAAIIGLPSAGYAKAVQRARKKLAALLVADLGERPAAALRERLAVPDYFRPGSRPDLERDAEPPLRRSGLKTSLTSTRDQQLGDAAARLRYRVIETEPSANPWEPQEGDPSRSAAAWTRSYFLPDRDRRLRRLHNRAVWRRTRSRRAAAPTSGTVALQSGESARS